MDPDRRGDLIARLRRMLPEGAPAPGDHPGSIVAVREADDEAVVILRFDGDPELYGIPIDLTDTTREFYYETYPAGSDDEWADSVGLGLEIMLSTGFRDSARRRRVGDHIELRVAGGWPGDERFCLQDGGHEHELVAERLREAGLDPDAALARWRQGRAVAWLLAYEDNATGGPWVGHALVARDEAGDVVLEQVETAPGVPSSLVATLAFYVVGAAASRGARTVVTANSHPVLDLAGFRDGPDGRRRVSCDLLDADPDGVRALIESELAGGGSWGRDRDEGGRHLPDGRVGRLLHRLRWGRSGRRPRVWAG